MPTTAENELRTMIGDLFMQLAMLRAEAINAKEPPVETKPNGKGKDQKHDQGDHPPQ